MRTWTDFPEMSKLQKERNQTLESVYGKVLPRI